MTQSLGTAESFNEAGFPAWLKGPGFSPYNKISAELGI